MRLITRNGLSFWAYPGLLSVQEHILPIMEFFHAVCTKHNIPYWLDGGSLLGLVRHQGFIPWDDDADVCVPAKHFPCLLDILSHEVRKHPSFYIKRFSRWKKNPVDHMVFSLSDFSRFRARKEGFDNVGLDVCSVITLPHDQRTLDESRNIALDAMAPYYQFPDYTPENKNAIDVFLSPGFLTKWDELPKRGQKAVLTYACHEGLAMLKYNDYSLRRNPHLYSDVFPLAKGRFEGVEFFIPNNPMTYLRNLYREPLEMPDVSSRKPYFESTFQSYISGSSFETGKIRDTGTLPLHLCCS